MARFAAGLARLKLGDSVAQVRDPTTRWLVFLHHFPRVVVLVVVFGWLQKTEHFAGT